MSKIVRAAAKRSSLIAGLARAPRKVDEIIQTEKKFSANTYSPLPVVFSSATGATVTDPSGKQYLDFLSAYGAVNQGHGNRRIINAAKRQLSRVSLSSRAFHCDNFATYAQFITKFFGYDRVLPMHRCGGRGNGG
jgi:ornithine--oxo-acid transaminase